MWSTGAGLLLLGLLLAGCGDPQSGRPAAIPTDPPATTQSAAPAATTPPAEPDPGPSASPGARPSAAPAPDPTVRLPWPAADATAVAQLQRSVDGGAEPWLLDPAEVAASYVGAAHGWTQAVAQPRPDGTTVDVAEGNHRLTLSLSQPGRAGAGGIWVVIGESPG